MAETAIRRGPTVPVAEWLTNLPPALRLAFYGGAAARAAAAPVWGAAFSEEPLRAHTRATRTTLWLGPDEYLLLDLAAGVPGTGPPAAGVPGASRPAAGGLGARASGNADQGAVLPALVQPAGAGDQGVAAAAPLDALESALAIIPHALVDISHRQFAFHVTGPHATNILSGACPLDLDPRAFPVGMCTRTVLAKADIVLWRTQESTFHLEVWRSFAAYVTGVLGEIAAEFYPAA